jgi:hypothetical protein
MKFGWMPDCLTDCLNGIHDLFTTVACVRACVCMWICVWLSLGVASTRTYYAFVRSFVCGMSLTEIEVFAD